MPTITSLGIGSGLNVQEIVGKLVEAEKAPTEARIGRQRDDIQAKLSAFGQIKSDLSSLRDALKHLKSPIFWQRRQATSSNEAVVTVTASAIAREGQHQVTVNRIATSHALATSGFSSVDEVVGMGTLSFRFGTLAYAQDGNPQSFIADPQVASQMLTIDASNNTLAGIRDAINRAGIGVRASIVNDGSGFRLVLSATETGEKRALEISVSDGDGNSTDTQGLSRLAFNASALNLTQTRQGQDATLIVDGLTVTSASNLVIGVIDGVSLNLKSASPEVVNLSVGVDEEAITESLQTFVDAYNRLKSHLAELASFQDGDKPSGVLLGDGTLRTVDNQLRRMLGQVVQGLENAGIRSLADVGLASDRGTGQLSLDAEKFKRLLRDQPHALQALFATQGTTTDARVQYFGAASKTQAGTYRVEVTRLATQGSYTGASVLPDFSTPFVVDGGNDEFTVEVDGVRSGTIAITQGSYASGTDLAREIQNRINADAALQAGGRHVEVSYDEGNGRFVLTSATYGSSSNIAFVSVDTNTAAGLGFNLGAGTAGQDVAGSLDGVEAVGRGQFLTGAEGSASEGLALKILGGVPGDRGSVTLVRGVADRLDDLIRTLSETGGLLSGKMDSLNRRLVKLAEEQQRLTDRIAQLEGFYLKKFNAMDALVAQFKSTSDFLTQQLEVLKPKTDDK